MNRRVTPGFENESQEAIVSKRTVINVGKYLLAIGLARLGDSPAIGRPRTARGSAYVWQTHVVEGKPIHLGYLLAAGRDLPGRRPADVLPLVSAGPGRGVCRSASSTRCGWGWSACSSMPSCPARSAATSSRRPCSARAEPANRRGRHGYHGSRHRPVGAGLVRGPDGRRLLADRPTGRAGGRHAPRDRR